MPAPQISDNEGIDFNAWLASIPSFAANWPQGVFTVARRVAAPAQSSNRAGGGIGAGVVDLLHASGDRT